MVVLLPVLNRSCLSAVVPIVPGIVSQIDNTLQFLLSTHQSLSQSNILAIVLPLMLLSSVRSRARFREFVHTLGRVVAKPTHQRVCAVATRRNTQN